MPSLFRLFVGAGLLLLFATSLVAADFDMTPRWDAETPLENPHKGWYHHFPDNHVNKYVIREDKDLLDFPGMDHLYIRLAWAYLEPEEGRYDWDVIDSIIEKWTANGLGISFRISCRETGVDRIEQQYATPKWVMEAGAKGGYYYKGERRGPDGPWEPEFDDPVFLEKLDHFLKAFAERYDGKPWLRYVDIGSIGDWGEGHTSSGSRNEYGYDVRRRHIDLHLKHFKKSQLVISDDFVHCVPDEEERRRLHEYIVNNGISYRDDSILVEWYVKTYLDTDTVRSPQYFDDVWRARPNVLELQHYGGVKRDGNWRPVAPGSVLSKNKDGLTGPDVLRNAVKRLRATYIGYHGYAHEWLADNPKLTGELLNRCGYWFFLHGVKTPDVLRAGNEEAIEFSWSNRGAAPAYDDFQLKLRLEGPETIDWTVDSGAPRWLPSDEEATTFSEKYGVRLPPDAKPGEYVLKCKLYCPRAERDVLLALDEQLRDDEGYFRIGEVQVAAE